MEKISNVEFKASIGSTSSKKEVNLYPISIRVINESSVDLRFVEVSVKDNDSNRVASATFSGILSGSEQQTTVQLPGGIEFCLWRVTPVVGKRFTGFGAANNAPGVDLKISD